MQHNKNGVSKRAKRKLLQKICKEEKKIKRNLPEPEYKFRHQDYVKKFLSAKDGPMDVKGTDDLVHQIAVFLNMPEMVFAQMERKIRLETRQKFEEKIKENYLSEFGPEFATLREQAELLAIRS